MQDLALGLVEPHHVYTGPLLKLFQVPGTGAIGQILASLILGRCTHHRACWQQVELSYHKGEKEFLATSWRSSLRGL